MDGINEFLECILHTPCASSAAHWRAARRRPFSRSAISIPTSVRDIRDLLVEVDRKQPGIVLV